MLDSAAFDALGSHLRAAFPLTFASLEVDTFGTHTYVLNWPGTGEKPLSYLFIAHLDVVPVDPQSTQDWDLPPFAGETLQRGDTTYLYGRGTLDDKSSALALLEGIESLLAEGYEPQHHLVFCLGQDEEIGGKNGAALVAQRFAQEGRTFEAILDEGGVISLGSIPGLKDVPVALVGTAEKGYLSVEVRFDLPGGHSSMPEAETALSKAAAFTRALTEEGLFEPEFSAPLSGFINHLAPEMPMSLRTVFANRFLFDPLLLHLYSESAPGRALTRTTGVATLFASGIKDNVVPASARVVCNSRILPGTTLDEVMNAYSELAAQFGGTVHTYTTEAGTQATATSDPNHPSFIALGQSIRQIFPEVLVSPYLTVGGTDSKHFQGLTNATYRFLPLTLDPAAVSSIHGTNERISTEAYEKMILFYSLILQRWGGGEA